MSLSLEVSLYRTREEAAKIDGATILKYFIQIISKGITPVLAS